ncbi:peptide chain release factor N(5)-glutamine methyltransferase [Lysobacter sp. TY2-98]|uniref:peptide chain release factor N(5)-glutamine methyltransferase n=1 Tax=Lysobacter sp. TY2-98 TaxID=2290922 RepID=UPI000E206491|nr:peptide chain release factor N(5)-glutamine methyltransferase [Lysobacter sp. TY2-98]AXK72593.1 peptide chain release factor N(5)-glutamine methyltransferase [Lysobacter sp. TY2-98]
MRIDALLREARARLPDGEAEILLAHALGHSPAWLYAHGDDEIDVHAREGFRELVDRRIAGEPVAYLVGRRGFWTLDLDVTPATLIPRPETERLVELAMKRIPSGDARVADLGTGSGAIALALATERPRAHVIATDTSADALAVARGNAKRLGLSRVDFREGSWYAPVADEHFDVIVSNPPYIAASDPHLAHGDLRHEPASALSSGADGLDAIRVIAAGATAHLVEGGWLLVEHGYDQGAAVRQVFTDAGLLDVATAQDLEHRDRVTLGRSP